MYEYVGRYVLVVKFYYYININLFDSVRTLNQVGIVKLAFNFPSHLGKTLIVKLDFIRINTY